MTYIDDSVAKLSYFEGSVPWMYRDTNGYVTVGVGQMLPSGTSAQALAFVDGANNPASGDSILTDYLRVVALPAAMNANSYRVQTSLSLTDATIAALLTAQVGECDSALNGRFANYGSFPDPAKLGLLDMVYNLGVHGLFSGFPTFMQYVGNTDWANAALQCHRVGPSDERNTWTKAQFQAAAALQSPTNVAGG
jgi:GH24 family phage-related lysozyme (muramidase)